MKRLTEDPAMPAELRADLLRSRRAGRDYDTLAKLPQLRSALSDASRQPPELEPRSSWSRLDVAPWTWKLALIAAIGGGVLVAAWPAQREQRPVIARQEPAPAPAVAAAPQTVEAPAPQSPELPAEAPKAATPAPSSRREIDQLQRVRATLERDPAAAYRLAQRSEQEFPNGLLSEERRALQILALAKTGASAAAERKARLFFARYPQSPMRERVEAALAR